MLKTFASGMLSLFRDSHFAISGVAFRAAALLDTLYKQTSLAFRYSSRPWDCTGSPGNHEIGSHLVQCIVYFWGCDLDERRPVDDKIYRIL